jgi:tripartite-type tricarboxylate transporter receptor subunit TctC
VPFLLKKVAYDVTKDFAAITRMGSYTLMLVVHPNVPANSVKELIAHAKANPGKLSYASGNTSGVVAGATLAHWAKIDLLHVPYKSAPPAIQDLLAGRVSMMFNDFTTSLPHIQAKTMRALAVTRIKRSALFPELPTMDEAGVEGFDMDSWAGIFAPAKTPQPIVTQLNTELRKIIDSADVKAKLRNAGFEAFSSSPEELEEFVRVQLAKWGRMIKDAGIQAE